MCKRYLPASDHEGVEWSRAPRGRGQAIATPNHLHSLNGTTYTTFITLYTHLSIRCKSRLDGMGMHMMKYLNIGVGFEWFVPETPYLIHDTTKAPHITGSGILPKVECLHNSKEQIKYEV